MNSVLLAVSALVPGVVPDEDPTIVGPELVELVLADPASSQPLCDAYGELTDLVAALTDDVSTQLVFVDVADAYAIISMEGDSFRFDNEARDVIKDWLHRECA
jgi:hypothetical protein